MIREIRFLHWVHLSRLTGQAHTLENGLLAEPYGLLLGTRWPNQRLIRNKSGKITVLPLAT